MYAKSERIYLQLHKPSVAVLTVVGHSGGGKR